MTRTHSRMLVVVIAFAALTCRWEAVLAFQAAASRPLAMEDASYCHHSLSSARAPSCLFALRYKNYDDVDLDPYVTTDVAVVVGQEASEPTWRDLPRHHNDSDDDLSLSAFLLDAELVLGRVAMVASVLLLGSYLSLSL